MKKIYTTILLLAISSTLAFAQSGKTKKADRLYDQMNYSEAAKEYIALLRKGESSTYVFERIGNSYYYLKDTKKAESYYRRLARSKKVNAETVYNYAQTLLINGKTNDYVEQMTRYAEMKPEDSRSRAFLQNPNYLADLTNEDNQEYTATNLRELNSKFSDFGGRMHNGEFYFTSARNTNRGNYILNDEPFLDIYKASVVGGVIKNAVLLDGDVNTKFHESTVAFSPDGKRMYFDRNDYHLGKYKKDSEGVNQLNIYYATNVDGRWTDIQSVSFNDHEYSNAHPALSPDGKMLYFTSNREGGKGETDIYRVSVNADGSFGTPENVSEINTEGREGFPFVAADGTLYFSSDGHMGMGGLDVYAAKPQGNGFGKPVNMGLGINSSDDDFAFYFDPENNEGFVSSNRRGGRGSDDIYKIEEAKECELIVNVNVIDAGTKAKLSDVQLNLFDNKENRLNSRTTDNSGQARFLTNCEHAHVVQASKEGYHSAAESVSVAAKGGEKTVHIALRIVEEIVKEGKVHLEPIHFAYDSDEILPEGAFELDKLVGVMERNQDMIIKVEGHTDLRGSAEYNLKLSDRRAKSIVAYVISKGISKDRISGEGFGKSRPIHDCGTKCTEKQHAENRRSEFIIVEE